MRYLLLLLLLPLTCFGQFGGFRTDQPFLAKDSISSIDPESYLPGGIAHRWKYTTISESPVTVWTDSIAGYNWVQTDSGAKPTWDLTNGVVFNGTSSALVGTNILTSQTETYLIVLKCTTSLANELVLGEANAAGRIFFGFNFDNVLYNLNGPLILMANHNQMDFLVSNADTQTGSRMWTNGVERPNLGVSFNDGVNITHIGYGSIGASSYFEGNIWEFIIWTNVGVFNDTQAENVHKYVKAVYNVTP